MTGDWTPTTSTVRIVFGEGMVSHGQTPDQAHASFDRWLDDLLTEAWDNGFFKGTEAMDKEIRAARADAWEHGHIAGWNDRITTDGGLHPETLNPHRVTGKS